MNTTVDICRIWTETIRAPTPLRMDCGTNDGMVLAGVASDSEDVDGLIDAVDEMGAVIWTRSLYSIAKDTKTLTTLEGQSGLAAAKDALTFLVQSVWDQQSREAIDALRSTIDAARVSAELLSNELRSGAAYHVAPECFTGQSFTFRRRELLYGGGGVEITRPVELTVTVFRKKKISSLEIK